MPSDCFQNSAPGVKWRKIYFFSYLFTWRRKRPAVRSHIRNCVRFGGAVRRTRGPRYNNHLVSKCMRPEDTNYVMMEGLNKLHVLRRPLVIFGMTCLLSDNVYPVLVVRGQEAAEEGNKEMEGSTDHYAVDISALENNYNDVFHTLADREYWGTRCPYLMNMVSGICDHALGNLFHLYAANSCFTADFTRKICCTGNPAQPVQNPFCFGGEIFNVLDPQVCCHGRWDLVVVPTIDKPVNFALVSDSCQVADLRAARSAHSERRLRFTTDNSTGADETGVLPVEDYLPSEAERPAPPPVVQNINTFPFRPTLGRVVAQICPVSFAPYRIVESARHNLDVYIRPGALEVAYLDLIDYNEDESRGDFLEEFDQAIGGDDRQSEDPSGKNHVPETVSMLRAKPRALIWRRLLNDPVPFFGLLLVQWRRQVPEGDLEFLEHEVTLNPVVDFTSPGRVPGALLLVAHRYHRDNDTRWETLVDMAEEKYLAEFGDHPQVSRAIPNTGHIPIEKFPVESTGLQDFAIMWVHILLDKIWTRINPPQRWRTIDYDRDDTWSMLMRATERINAMAPNYEEEWEKNWHLASPMSVLGGGGGGGGGGGQGDHGTKTITKDDEAGEGPTGEENQSPVPEYAKPFLYFVDDPDLYKTAHRCKHYSGIMSEARKSVRRLAVLDVSLPSSLCAEQWKAIPSVDYIHHEVTVSTTSPEGQESPSFLSQMRDTQDIIPFAPQSMDLVLCDHVLEHLPEPVKAVRELYDILKPGGRLFIGQPYGGSGHQHRTIVHGGQRRRGDQEHSTTGSSSARIGRGARRHKHYSGGFTHAWFEQHLLLHSPQEDSSQRQKMFERIWWNYRYEKMGQALGERMFPEQIGILSNNDTTQSSFDHKNVVGKQGGDNALIDEDHNVDPINDNILMTERYKGHHQRSSCIEKALGNYADALLYRKILSTIVPAFVDVGPALCPGAERRVEKINVVAEK